MDSENAQAKELEKQRLKEGEEKRAKIRAEKKLRRHTLRASKCLLKF